MHLRSIVQAPVPDPTPYKNKATTKRICTFDTETDPFKQGRVPKVFTCGFYDGENYFDFWGEDCIDQWADFVTNTYEPNSLMIYVHNLPFDFHYIKNLMDVGTYPTIVNKRIIKCSILEQEFRDSFKILPVALSKIQKDEIDYAKLESTCREEHKEEILRYQFGDCYYLYNAVVAFREQFGDALTIGNVAIRMLSSFTGFQRLSARADEGIREYFYGGRVECFEQGVLEDDWKVFDVNSMYPDAMARYRHPISNTIHNRRYISEQTAFVHCTGWSKGAFPVRTGFADLAFPHGYGEFKVTIHEYNTAIELGLFHLKKIIATKDFSTWADFSPFINHFYDARLVAKSNGDALNDLFYKLLLNNAYGKFAQNPKNFTQAFLTDAGRYPPGGIYHAKDNPNGWRLGVVADYGWIWERPSKPKRSDYYNVATGASITGAARATLLRGIASANRPVYCDTDSIIAKGLGSDMLGDPHKLGAWKTEAEGDRIGIAGKKTYVLYRGDKVVKKASKGVKLHPWEILEVADGGTIVHISDVPTFGMNGDSSFMERVIRATA